MSFQTVDEFLESIRSDASPPADASPEVKSMWLAKKGEWDAAHDIAQDIDTPMGSWIHAHLHLLEGDIGNARYWYSRAGKPARGRGEEIEGWAEIAAELIGG